MTLHTLIECLTLNNNIHICINDVSGILSQSDLKIRPEYTLHSKPFCLWAKSTAESNRLCYNCKHRTIKMAVEQKAMFAGRCAFGITEIVCPVEIGGDVKAVIYIGNLTNNIGKLRKIIEKRARKLRLPDDKICGFLKNFCIADDFTPYMTMAELIRDMIITVYDKSAEGSKSSGHWVVDALKNYAKTYYNTEMSLSELSKIYYFNENYIGRLFKKETGMTFSEYLNSIRLEKAIELLRTTSLSILKTAAFSGFNNVTYFNRLFKRKTGVSPSAYRDKAKGSSHS